jgi:hypothetical protein
MMVVVTVRLPPLIEFSSFAFKVFKVYFRIKLVGSRCRCDPYVDRKLKLRSTMTAQRCSCWCQAPARFEKAGAHVAPTWRHMPLGNFAENTTFNVLRCLKNHPILR